jgi:hypothetical protein
MIGPIPAGRWALKINQGTEFIASTKLATGPSPPGALVPFLGHEQLFRVANSVLYHAGRSGLERGFHATWVLYHKILHEGKRARGQL